MFVYCRGTLLKTGPELLRYATGDEMRACQVVASELALQGKYLGDNALGKAKYIDLTQAGMEVEAEIPKESPELKRRSRSTRKRPQSTWLNLGLRKQGGPIAIRSHRCPIDRRVRSVLLIARMRSPLLIADQSPIILLVVPTRSTGSCLQSVSRRSLPSPG